MYCLVISDVDIAEYTKVEIHSIQGNPVGFSCFQNGLPMQFSGDIRQLKAQYGIP